MSAPPVLFLESREAHGGDVQVLHDMLGALSGAGRHALVACLAGGPVAGRARLPEGVRVVPLPFGHGATRRARLAGALATLAALRRLVRDEGIRVVHANNTRRTLTFALALVSTLPSPPRLVYHAHCEPQRTLSHRLALRRATEVWAVSEFIAASYRDAGVPDSRLRVMPNSHGFDEPGPASAPAIPGVPVGARVALLVGRLTPTKGQDLAVEAMAVAGVPDDLHLVLVGDDAIADRNAGFREGLARRAQALGLRERVHFAGFVSDPSPYYAASDVVLLPSMREPFGLTALEAAAACRPIVASDEGGFREILGDGAGLRLVSRRPDAFAAAIQQVLAEGQDPPPREVRRRLASRYGRDAFSRRLIDALDPLSA